MLTNLEVSLADMYTGRTVEVSPASSLLRRLKSPVNRAWLNKQFDIPRKIICRHCHGSGAHSEKDIQECNTCGGRGMMIQRHQVFPGMFTNVQMT